MNIPFGLRAFVGVFFFHACIKSCRGQYHEDVKKNYVKMSLGVIHRGSFNNTQCIKDLLNCWENIKSDVVCSDKIVYESLCGMLRRVCVEANAMPWLSPSTVPVHEGFCDIVRVQTWLEWLGLEHWG